MANFKKSIFIIFFVILNPFNHIQSEPIRLQRINTPGKHKLTERYFIEKGRKKLITSPEQGPIQKLNSGNPQTLVDAAIWAMKYYPAENFILNLWSHGSGICDPIYRKNIYEENI